MGKEDWGKLIVAKGFQKLPKVQKISTSGHTGSILLHFCAEKLSSTYFLCHAWCIERRIIFDLQSLNIKLNLDC